MVSKRIKSITIDVGVPSNQSLNDYITYGVFFIPTYMSVITFVYTNEKTKVYSNISGSSLNRLNKLYYESNELTR